MLTPHGKSNKKFVGPLWPARPKGRGTSDAPLIGEGGFAKVLQGSNLKQGVTEGKDPSTNLILTDT